MLGDENNENTNNRTQFINNNLNMNQINQQQRILSNSPSSPIYNNNINTMNNNNINNNGINNSKNTSTNERNINVIGTSSNIMINNNKNMHNNSVTSSSNNGMQFKFHQHVPPSSSLLNPSNPTSSFNPSPSSYTNITLNNNNMLYPPRLYNESIPSTSSSSINNNSISNLNNNFNNFNRTNRNTNHNINNYKTNNNEVTNNNTFNQITTSKEIITADINHSTILDTNVISFSSTLDDASFLTAPTCEELDSNHSFSFLGNSNISLMSNNNNSHHSTSMVGKEEIDQLLEIPDIEIFGLELDQQSNLSTNSNHPRYSSSQAPLV
ncbi:hypothetical protein ABK040_004066 [Willaertia magna]